ncbi:MAG: hypothetical protein KA740_03085 [Rhodoferax sp.]|jgi:hypothetical protein|nr:hypothetical protein [Rhodoferax sp.]
MAMGWMTVLKMVPWGDVIENAPKVASGAKKLWAKVGNKPPPGAASANGNAPSGPHALTGQDAIAALRTQVADLQVATAELHQQMFESSALIQSLADQNAQLVQRIELNRKRLLVLVLVTVAFGVALVLQYIR